MCGKNKLCKASQMCSVLHDLSLMCRVFSEEILFTIIFHCLASGLASNENGDIVILHSKMSRCNFAIFQSNFGFPYNKKQTCT